MCGIFLHYDPGQSRCDLLTSYQKMSASLAHRGPDAMGVTAIPELHHPLAGKTVTLEKKGKECAFCPIGDDFFQSTQGFIGHHRLAIIDLDITSAQPFLDPSSRVALSYNGMLYNYLELRRQLVDMGFSFQTSSDTEVVLNAYLAWDAGCFERFNGDFALLLYDHRKRSIVGARDRFGVRPLFYRHTGKTITFSSELKGFLGLPGYTPALNKEVAYRYLVADFPTPETLKESFLQNVHSVPPAHFFAVDLTELAITVTPYWGIREEGSVGERIPSFDDAAARFDALLSDAVRIRLRSDVKLGSFLSGGLDSPSMVWHAIQGGAKIPTFSSVFPGSPVDESGNILTLAQAFDIPNYRREVDFDDFDQGISNLVWLQDEPFSTLNVYTQFKNVQHAKDNGVKVILDGGGADEFLAGYTDYRILAAADGGDASYLTTEEKDRLRRFMELSSGDLRAWHSIHERKERTVSYINPEYRRAFQGGGPPVDRPLDSNYKKQFMGSFLKNGLFHSVAGSWMNKSIEWDNRYLDRTGLSIGIEGRVPFQDHRLVEFVFSLPHDYLYRDGFSKYILRKTMRDRLPLPIISAREKVGYDFPFTEFITDNRTFRNFFYGLTEQSHFKEFDIIDRSSVVSELDNIKNGQSKNYNLWRVFNLYLWCQLFIS